MRRLFPALARALPCLLAYLLSAPGCVAPPRMCDAQFACAGTDSCVAGRCVASGATPAINGARRLLFTPVDAAFLKRGQGPSDATPALATLGDGRDPQAMALLRFAVPLPPEATVLEAYLLLERADGVEADPSAVMLHASRIVESWDGRSVSWATQPRIEETGGPVTRVASAAARMVRLDVHGIVESWRQRSGDDFGLAVVAQADGAGSGLPFALRPGSSDRQGPRLELYIK